MTALWLDPDVEPHGPVGPWDAPNLRLVGPCPAHRPDEVELPGRDGYRDLRLVERPERAARDRGRRTSAAVRRRRTLVAAIAIFVVALALPLSGTGGHSHATGSAPAETGAGVAYTVQPGDTLWTIAERVDPTADPRPLVARLAAQTGSDSVVPGEHIDLP